MQTIFHLVFIFDHVANKLPPNLKDIVCMKKDTPFNPLMLACIKPHNYDQDRNEVDTKISSLFLFSSTVYSSAFVQLAHNTNDISCKFFVILPVYCNVMKSVA